jgi:hypothetical protein
VLIARFLDALLLVDTQNDPSQMPKFVWCFACSARRSIGRKSASASTARPRPTRPP